VGGLTKKIAL